MTIREALEEVRARAVSLQPETEGLKTEGKPFFRNGHAACRAQVRDMVTEILNTLPDPRPVDPSLREVITRAAIAASGTYDPWSIPSGVYGGPSDTALAADKERAMMRYGDAILAAIEGHQRATA